MTTVTLRLVYDGLGATHHKMPSSMVKQITTGAQEFLGAHAYYFTEGKIPANVADHSAFFRIHDIRESHGSWIAQFTVELQSVPSEFLVEYVREVTKLSAVEAALATKLGFIWLVNRAYKSWKERRPLQERTFERIEPVLSDFSGNGAPIIDQDRDSEQLRRRLYERTTSSMTKITAPLGRAAAHVDIWVEDIRLDCLEQRVFSEDEIAQISAALIPIRQRMGRLPY